MEKNTETAIKIAIIGPESTAKTTLSNYLSLHYNGICIPEFAREYIEKLNRPYNMNDVEIIAKKQLLQISVNYTNKYVFYDTDLIITKIWFKELYNHCPEWILNSISLNYIDFYLLCKPDIPWVADNVRENGGEKRNYLYNCYENELKNYKLKYGVIEGTGNTRVQNAINTINRFIE